MYQMSNEVNHITVVISYIYPTCSGCPNCRTFQLLAEKNLMEIYKSSGISQSHVTENHQPLPKIHGYLHVIDKNK